MRPGEKNGDVCFKFRNNFFISIHRSHDQCWGFDWSYGRKKKWLEWTSSCSLWSVDDFFCSYIDTCSIYQHDF